MRPTSISRGRCAPWRGIRLSLPAISRRASLATTSSLKGQKRSLRGLHNVKHLGQIVQWRRRSMTMGVNRRLFLKTTAGVIAIPITGIGSAPAFAAREELIVRFEYDITNMDPPNRTGSVEDNII